MSFDTRRTWAENWPAAAFGLILRICLAVAVAYVLYRVGFILVVVLVSVMLALAMAPLVDAVRRAPLLSRLSAPARRTTATSIVFLSLAVVLVLLSIVVIHPMADQIVSLSRNWQSHKVTLTQQFQHAQNTYNDLPEDVRVWVEEQGVKDLGRRAGEQLQLVAHRTMESGLLLVELILVPVLAFSFLTESRPLKREFLSLLPRARVRDGVYLLNRTAEILQAYALGQLILAVIAGGVVYALMLLVGVPYALPLALLAAITRVIPVIGPLIGGIPIVLISAAGPKGLHGALVVLVAFTVMHLLESKVVMPRIIGHRIQLHPALVIIVLLIGAQFFGMWGMFLAAPVAAVVKVLLQQYLVGPRTGARRRGRPSRPSRPAPTSVNSEEERNIERPAVAGVRHHSGAH